ncbi:MAG: alpha/beta fold hydrolase [Myxococcota bacterium]
MRSRQAPEPDDPLASAWHEAGHAVVAHLLGGERRFYGLQALGLYGDQQPHETFEEMAAAYIAELRTVQEKGPYLLGGFSGGGITALEMAQQLKGAGEEVGLLVMLDTPVPVRPGLTPSDRVKVQLQRLRDRGPGYVGEWAKNRWAWEVGKLRARFEEPETRGEGEFHNEAIEAAFRRALDHYALQSYDGRITLFRPRLDEHYVLGEDRILSQEMEWQWHDNGWTPHASEVMVHEVPGNHDSMVLEPNVRVLAESLRQAIDDAETRAPEHKATVVSSGEARPADSV